jgi:chorismate mutase/prephenate dehydratase
MRLDELRREIDSIDDDLVTLLNKRSTLVLRALQLKIAAGMAFSDPDREGSIIERACNANKGPLDRSAIITLFRCVIDESSRIARLLEPSGQ